MDPFGGVIKDGYIYGSGSCDDKGMLAANLAAFIALKRSSVHLNRDVIFLATADEEQFGDASIKTLNREILGQICGGLCVERRRQSGGEERQSAVRGDPSQRKSRR